MNELPLILDNPVSGPGAGIGPAATPAPGPALSRRRPLWTAPAWLIGRFRPRLRAAATADALALERYPRLLVEVLPVLLVVVVAVGFAAIHGMHHYQNSQAGLEWGRWVLADTFFEVPIFLLLAILIGETLPSLGVVFVLLFATLDIGVSATQPQELTPLPGALVGRLISMWALWLLVVEIPVFGRSLAGSWRAVARNRVVAAALAGLTAGVITWFWTQAAPILERPMFVWSDLGSVAIAAYRPVQEAGGVFAVFAGAVAATIVLLRGPATVLEEEPPEAGSSATARVRGVLRALVVAALLTITLGGVIASPFEGAVLFVVLLSAGPLAGFLADRTVIGTVVRVTPVAVRYV
ncbi:MAG: hypothetical protein M3O87_07245, partial [Candidatus Dormibacteraeota bacterium]|nr:hypothetical protein [Candidatus Dormibacteraeota bacterium]